MGTINHTALIVTSVFDDKIAEVHGVAVERFGPLVTPLMPMIVNGGSSFMIAPDGSKEYWLISDKRDSDQELFIKYVNITHNSVEGGHRNQFVEMAEVTFGETDVNGKISVPSAEV